MNQPLRANVLLLEFRLHLRYIGREGPCEGCFPHIDALAVFDQTWTAAAGHYLKFQRFQHL